MSPPPQRPDIQVVRRVVAILVAVFVLGVALVVPSPPEVASAVPAEEDYVLGSLEPVPLDRDAPAVIGEDVRIPTGHVARVAAVEVHEPDGGAVVAATTLEVHVELRRDEPTNLHPRGPVVEARLADGRLYRAEPRCPGDDWPRRAEVTDDEPAHGRVCVRVPPDGVGEGVRLELWADLADGGQELRWQVDPELDAR